MEVTSVDLRKRYSFMQDEELIALRGRNGLTEEAHAVLDEILRERGVSQEQVECISAREKEERVQEIWRAAPSVEEYWRKLCLSFYVLVSSILVAYLLHESQLVLVIFAVTLISSAACYYYFLGRLAYFLGRSVIAWVGLAMLVPFGIGKIIALVLMKGHVSDFRNGFGSVSPQKAAENAN